MRTEGGWLRRLLAASATCALAIAALAGCSDDSPNPDKAAAEKAARAFAVAFLDARGAAACDLMTADSQSEMARRTESFLDSLVSLGGDEHASADPVHCPGAVQLTSGFAQGFTGPSEPTPASRRAARVGKAARSELASGGGIGEVEIDGDSATAELNAFEEPLALARVDGEWLVDVDIDSADGRDALTLET